MADQRPGPLGETDLEEIRSKLADLDDAERVIDQAIRGGIDMTDQRRKAQELRTQLMKVKGSFFPGR